MLLLGAEGSEAKSRSRRGESLLGWGDKAPVSRVGAGPVGGGLLPWAGAVGLCRELLEMAEAERGIVGGGAQEITANVKPSVVK